MIPFNMLSLIVSKDAEGDLSINVDCNNFDFDPDLLTDLIEKALETASGVMSPSMLH